MKKQILTIGYEIPGQSDNYQDFSERLSLMDADIILISPDSFSPSGDWVSFTSSDGGCYNVESSRAYKEKIEHLRKELKDHLDDGKNIFVFMSKEEELSLASGVTSPRKGQNTYSTHKYSNYNFLPLDIGRLTSASGSYIQFSGNPIFSDFYNKFKDNLKYELYVEGSSSDQVVFTGKNKAKILGAIYKAGKGHLVTLPLLPYKYDDFLKTKVSKDGEEKYYWNKKGIVFGNNLVQCLLEIDTKLSEGSKKTPPPKWILQEEFLTKKEKGIHDSVNANIEKIKKLEQKNKKLEVELEEELKLKDLLFEQGKPLENAIIKALELLGYEAENYNDGELEMDQVITSPEGYRYIGESEGKDKKDINVTKFRQLIDALNADFTRDEVEERAFGILFGNAERLKEPKKRNLDFTAKCKSGAKREGIALVKTVDLFIITKYLRENNDRNFKKECRDAIHKNLGEIVVFPTVPKER